MNTPPHPFCGATWSPWPGWGASFVTPVKSWVTPTSEVQCLSTCLSPLLDGELLEGRAELLEGRAKACSALCSHAPKT